MADTEIRCGNCRRFSPNGKKDADGRRLGYCEEFPCASGLTEDCACHPSDAFRPKAYVRAARGVDQKDVFVAGQRNYNDHEEQPCESR